MAIRKLPSGNFQARLSDHAGRILTEVFPTRLEAEEQVIQWKKAKQRGKLVKPHHRTFGEFFEEWFADNTAGGNNHAVKSGWRGLQRRYFEAYIRPILGNLRLKDITPQSVKRVLIRLDEEGLSPETQRLVFATMRKMLGDAVENYQYITFNPAIRKLKPKVVVKEARHLNLSQCEALLSHVNGKRYGLAIWLQLYLGLRAGELTALRWEDIDLEYGRVTIRRTYARKTSIFRDYPKGGKQHSHTLPKELWEALRDAKETAASDLVVTSPEGSIIPYNRYLKVLKDYCKEAGVPIIGTHGLRHSTSELYMHHGASRDDLRRLFAHSSPTVTDRYIHDRGTNLERVAKVINLFGKKTVDKIDHENRPRFLKKGEKAL